MTTYDEARTVLAGAFRALATKMVESAEEQERFRQRLLSTATEIEQLDGGGPGLPIAVSGYTPAFQTFCEAFANLTLFANELPGVLAQFEAVSRKVEDATAEAALAGKAPRGKA